MLVRSTHLPFSGVCSTVSSWVLLFTIIFPPTNVLGFEVSSTPCPSSSDHHGLRHHSHVHHTASISISAHLFAGYLDSTPDEWLSDSASYALLPPARSCPADVAGKCHNSSGSSTTQRKAPSQRQKTLPQFLNAGNGKAASMGRVEGLDYVDPVRKQPWSCMISTKNTNRVTSTRLGDNDDCRKHHQHHQGSSVETIWSMDSQAHTACGCPESLSLVQALIPCETSTTSLSHSPVKSVKQVIASDMNPDTGIDSDSDSDSVPTSRVAMTFTVHDATTAARPITFATPFARTTMFLRSKPAALERVSVRQHRRYITTQSAARRFVHRLTSLSPFKAVQDTLLLVRDDSMTGKLAKILMSTLCGVGVGMFGALLFVLVLNVRPLQTRHIADPSQTRSDSQRHHEAQWRTAGLNCKKVVPKMILESFRVQTVLQASSALVLTPAGTKSEVVALTRFKLEYANNVIEMEELTARENARQQRVRTMTGLFPRAAGVATGTDTGSDGVVEGEEMEQVPMAHSNDAILSSNATPLSQNDPDTAIMEHSATAVIRHSQSRHGQPESDILTRLGASSAVTAVHTSMGATTLISSPQPSLALSTTEFLDEKHRVCTASHTSTNDKQQEPFANANEQTMCSICLTDYEVGDQVKTLPCYHQYHASCIDPWLLQVTSLCPICKRDLWPSSE